MEKNKKAQEKILSEEQLEEAAGGNLSGNCYFEPEVPLDYEYNRYMGTRVKCKSNCLAKLSSACRCHGTDKCRHRYHLVEQANPGVADGNWIASPRGEFNHSESRKLIKGLFV